VQAPELLLAGYGGGRIAPAFWDCQLERPALGLLSQVHWPAHAVGLSQRQQRGHEHVGCYVSCCYICIVEDESRVRDVQRIDGVTVEVMIEQQTRAPDCGVLTGTVKDRPVTRLKGMPASGERDELWWRERRLLRRPLCPRKTFTSATRCQPRAREPSGCGSRWRSDHVEQSGGLRAHRGRRVVTGAHDPARHS
jgi:hypothetical protein